MAHTLDTYTCRTHSHGLADTVGYRVLHTISDGTPVSDPAIRDFDGDTSYLEALTYARTLRTIAGGRIVSYAVVASLYR